MKTGAFMLIGSFLAFAGILGLAAAIIAAVAASVGLAWGFVAGAAFVFFVGGICLIFAAVEPSPVERKASTAPDYSPLLRIVEDVASDVVAGPRNNHPAGGTTKALLTALAAGAVLGFVEQVGDKSV